MKSLLIHLRPIDLSTGARVNVYVGSAADAAALGLGDRVWESAVVRRPRMSIELVNDALDGKVQTGRADVVVNHNNIRQVANPQSLYWSGAPVVIYDASDLNFATMPIEFTGIVRSGTPDLDTDQITLNMEVSTLRLQRPLLPDSFTGQGGLTGDAGKRGVLKPAGFGNVPNVEPVWFDETRNIGMVDGYGNLLAISWAGEGLSSLGPPVANYPSYAQLALALDDGLIPRGRWATSIAAGCIGLGAPPTGVVTCDCLFGSNRPGAWIRRLLEIHADFPTGDIDIPSLEALDLQVNRPVHYWTNQQREVLDLIEAIAASCNATPIMSFQGKFAVTRAFGGDTVGVLNRLGTSSPRVTGWESGDPEPPTWRMEMIAARPGRVLSYDEVNYEDELIDRGGYRATETYRIGHMVWMPNGSQWLYINQTPSAGHQPPAPPATEDAYWFQTKPPTTASDLYYEDGTPIEALKPGMPGATRNVNRGAWAPGTLYLVGDIVQYDGTSYNVDITHTSNALEPPPNGNVSVFVTGGTSAPALQIQWSVDGVTGWHSTFVDGDIWMRQSTDGGISWSPAMRAIGEGGEGTVGNFIQFVFKRSASQPATPSGGGIPATWSDAPPAANGQPLWMTKAEQASGGALVGSWSTPIQMDALPVKVQWSINGVSAWHDNYTAGDLYMRQSTDGGTTWSSPQRAIGEEGEPGEDGNVTQFVFRRSNSQPATPTGNNIPSGWFDAPPADNGQPLWMAKATQDTLGQLIGTWSVPVQISAFSVRIQWSVNGTTLWHDNFVIGDIFMRQSTDGGATWGTAVRAVGEDGDGIPGNFTQFVFKRSALQPAAPTGNGIPATWFDAPPAANGQPLWMSNAEQTDAGVLVGSWTIPIRLDGQDGASTFRMVNVENMSIGIDSVVKVTGGAAWNGRARTEFPYIGGATFAGKKVASSTMMMGLTTDPEAGLGSYTSLDYALYVYMDVMQYYVYRNGVGHGPLGMASANDIMQVRVDNKVVRYMANDDLLYEHPVNAPNEALYGVVVSGGVGEGLKDISFSAAGSMGDDGEKGDPGNQQILVFRRSPTPPATPTGNGTPSGWSQTYPAGNEPLWMSRSQQMMDGTLIGAWSAPIRWDQSGSFQGEEEFDVANKQLFGQIGVFQLVDTADYYIHPLIMQIDIMGEIQMYSRGGDGTAMGNFEFYVDMVIPDYGTVQVAGPWFNPYPLSDVSLLTIPRTTMVNIPLPFSETKNCLTRLWGRVINPTGYGGTLTCRIKMPGVG